MIKTSFQIKDVVKCRCVWQPPTTGSMVSLHLGSKHETRILCPEPQSPQMPDPDRSRKDITPAARHPATQVQWECTFQACNPVALSKGGRSGAAQQRLEGLPLNRSCPELQKENVSFIHKGMWIPGEKLGHCPRRGRQSSAFCTCCFLCEPKIEPLNQTPLCGRGNHCALYNFTVGFVFYSFSDINLSQFSGQGFTYFTNSNCVCLTFVLIQYPKHKAPSGRQVLSLFFFFNEIPGTLSSN